MKVKNRNRWLTLFAIVIAAIGMVATQQVQASERTAANVTFSRSALNPADPRLPLADTSADAQVQPSHNNTESQVVVNTTPEPTKVGDQATTEPAKAAPAATSTRTKLPQTGSVTLPAMLVGAVIVLSMGFSLRLLTPRRRLVA